MYQIMLVDDEVHSSEIIQKYIEAQLPSYEICGIYSNGLDALETFSRQAADIVLIDIRMPVMDGLTLISKLNEITTDYIPIILSGFGDFSYAKTAMNLGVSQYLLKPVDFDELHHSLMAAERRLISQRLFSNHLSWRKEDQETLLTQLLSGNYTDSTLEQTKFEALDFPFSYYNCHGIYVRISFSNAERWNYEKETLYTAVCNMVHLLYSPLLAIPLFRKKNQCDYLIIRGSHSLGSLENLIKHTESILGITITISMISLFSSMEQLRTASVAAYQGLSKSSDVLENTNNAFEDATNLPADNVTALIKSAIAYMNEHYAEDLSRDELARKVHMSGSYFSRSFKMVTHSSYKDYLTDIRMKKAIELLNTDMPINLIAKQVGYPNPCRFNVNFRNYTSYTPSDYRFQVLKII